MKRLLKLFAVVLLLITGCTSVPATWQEQYDEGMEYLEEKNYEEAISAFTQAIEIDSTKTQAYLMRATAYIDSGSATSAMKDYERVAELDENCLEAYEGMVDIYLKWHMPDMAQEVVENIKNEQLRTALWDKFKESLGDSQTESEDIQVTSCVEYSRKAVFPQGYDNDKSHKIEIPKLSGNTAEIETFNSKIYNQFAPYVENLKK